MYGGVVRRRSRTYLLPGAQRFEWGSGEYSDFRHKNGDHANRNSPAAKEWATDAAEIQQGCMAVVESC